MSCSSCKINVEEVGCGGSTSNCNHLFCSPCIENKVKIGTIVDGEIGCSIEYPDGSICRGYFTIKEIKSLIDEKVFENFCSLPNNEKIIDSEEEDSDEDEQEGEDSDSAIKINEEDIPGGLVERHVPEEQLLLSFEEKNTSWGQLAQKIKELMDSGSSYAQATEIIDKIPVWVTNQEISCIICSEEKVPVRQGIILKDCLHAFCRTCLGTHIKYADTSVEVGCPFVEGDYKCDSVLKPKELKLLSSEAEYKKHYEDLSIRELESLPNVYNCRTPNCGYKCIVDQDEFGASAVKFRCPKCRKNNCTICKVIHEKGCQEYWQRIEDEEKERIRLANELMMREEKEKRDRLNKLEQERLERVSEAEIQAGLNSGIYEKCPNCAYLCHKYTGCNHVVCSKCKHKFNWGGQPSGILGLFGIGR